MKSAPVFGVAATLLWTATEAFAPRPFTVHSSTALDITITTQEQADLFGEVGYTTTSEKPLGAVFGENGEPFGGLRVDDLDPELNGKAAGLKVGDQLMAVNGVVVVGESFETGMDLLRNSPTPVQLQLFRGNVRSLYTTLENTGVQLTPSEDEEEDEDEVVMDENYESPVQIDVSYLEREASVDNVFKKLGESLGGSKDGKKGGLFSGMFSQDTIQLDGDDARGLK